MHKHQMSWHFLSCQTIIFLSVYLQLMIEFQSFPPLRKKREENKPISALCMYPQHTQLLRAHGSMHSKAYLQPLDGAYGNSLDYFSPSPKHRCVLWD